MILDGLLMFTGAATGIGNSDGLTDSPTTGTQVASNILDLGLTGIPESADGGGARDIAPGCPLHLFCQVTTAFTGGTSLQAELSGAPDDGSGSPDTYVVMWTGQAVVLANLTVGARIANVKVPLVVPGQALPRFLRMRFITVGTHTAGAVTGTITLDKDDQPGSQDGTLSGYPAGITVSN